ncbi:MAG: hypothetical protein LBH02_03430 [Methanocalculaceae archaeon]|jgi:hypothetical protein|nr:hypothetical protein [Methanocalculaceae archaeon]
MAIVEIQLNRLGINSLELSTNVVDVSAGTSLHILFVNRGSPTHATLRCEASAYTDFTYENIYVEGELELEIKMKVDAGAGCFDMQIITGYGMRREAFTVNLLKPCPIPAPDSFIVPNESIVDPKKTFVSGETVMIFIIPIVTAIIIVLWQFGYLNIDGYAMTIIVYLVMLVGVIIAWHSAQ